jgi:hypothetical protein
MYLELGAISNQESAVSCVFCNGHTTSKSVPSPMAEYSAEQLLYETLSCQKSDNGSPNSQSSPVTDLGKVDIGIDSPSKNSWECLELYRELVQSPDNKLSHTITSHLLKVAPRCTPSVKRLLLFKVFYPTFIAAKTCWFGSSSSLDIILNAKLNILSCLSAFSSILSTDVAFAEEFVVQYRGLDHILELISLPSFSKLCCSVLEVTSVVEIWKLKHENGDTEADVGKLPSLRMLHEAVQSATTRVLSYLGINAPVKVPEGATTEPSCHEAVENVLGVEKTDEVSATLAVNGQDNKILLDDLTQEIKVKCNMCIAIDRLNKESYVQLLAAVCVFWRTCANLVLYSPQYREHLSQNPLAHDGLTLLQVLLDRVTSKQQSGKLYFV